MAAYLRRCAKGRRGIVSMRLTFWLSLLVVAAVAASSTTVLIFADYLGTLNAIFSEEILPDRNAEKEKL